MTRSFRAADGSRIRVRMTDDDIIRAVCYWTAAIVGEVIMVGLCALAAGIFF